MKKFYDTKNKKVILALLAVLLISLGVLASQNIKEGMKNKKEGMKNKKEGYKNKKEGYKNKKKEGFENKKKEGNRNLNKDKFNPQKITDFMNGVADQPNAIISGFQNLMNINKERK